MKLISDEFVDFSSPVGNSSLNPSSQHASCIAFYKDKPYIACFGGTREGETDVAIYINHDDKNVVIGASDQIPRWNPILHVVDDKLYLWEKAGLFCDRWQTFLWDLSNVDFSTPIESKDQVRGIIPAGLNGPVKTKPIMVNDILYCGSSVETIFNWASYIEAYGKDFIILDRTQPLVVAPRRYTNVYGYPSTTMGIIQPSLWLDNDKAMHAFFRSSKGLGLIYHASCKVDDNGYYLNDWTPPLATDFPNPNSGMDTVYYDSKLYLVYNPDHSLRTPLVLSRLDDSFKEEERIVLKQCVSPDVPYLSRELSYPYMVEHDGALHITYTYGRTRIVHATVEI